MPGTNLVHWDEQGRALLGSFDGALVWRSRQGVYFVYSLESSYVIHETKHKCEKLGLLFKIITDFVTVAKINK